MDYLNNIEGERYLTSFAVVIGLYLLGLTLSVIIMSLSCYKARREAFKASGLKKPSKYDFVARFGRKPNLDQAASKFINRIMVSDVIRGGAISALIDSAVAVCIATLLEIFLGWRTLSADVFWMLVVLLCLIDYYRAYKKRKEYYESKKSELIEDAKGALQLEVVSAYSQMQSNQGQQANSGQQSMNVGSGAPELGGPPLVAVRSTQQLDTSLPPKIDLTSSGVAAMNREPSQVVDRSAPLYNTNMSEEEAFKLMDELLNKLESMDPIEAFSQLNIRSDFAQQFFSAELRVLHKKAELQKYILRFVDIVNKTVEAVKPHMSECEYNYLKEHLKPMEERVRNAPI